MQINSFIRNYKIGSVITIILLMCVAAFAQPGKRFAQAQQENEAKLRHYTWKSRTEVRKDGETKSVQLNQIRYDIDQNLQQNPISVSQQEIPTGGLRGLIAKKKKEDFVQSLNDLSALAKSYGKISPSKMQQFIRNATFIPEINPSQNLIRIQGSDVLELGDSMTIWVDAVTFKQRKIEVKTYYDTHRVRIISEFQNLPNGPTYLARSIIDYPNKELVITTENFDFTRKQ